MFNFKKSKQSHEKIEVHRVAEVCRKMGISEASFFNWKKNMQLPIEGLNLRSKRTLERPDNDQIHQCSSMDFVADSCLMAENSGP